MHPIPMLMSLLIIRLLRLSFIFGFKLVVECYVFEFFMSSQLCAFCVLLLVFGLTRTSNFIGQKKKRTTNFIFKNKITSLCQICQFSEHHLKNLLLKFVSFAVEFDHSGSYLVLAGSDIRLVVVISSIDFW